MKTALVLMPLVVTQYFLMASHGFGSTDFPKAVDQVYSKITRFIWSEYIEGNGKSITLLPVSKDAHHEITITRNMNIVLADRLNRRLQKSNLSGVEVTRGNRRDVVDSNTVFLAIAVNDVQVVPPDSFSFSLVLKELAPNKGMEVRKEWHTGGRDNNLDFFIHLRYKPGLDLWLLIVLLVVVVSLSVLRRIKGLRFLREENLPYLRMTFLYLLLTIIFFFAVYWIERIAIEGHTYYEGAEVHFFIDRNDGLFFEAPADKSIGTNNFPMLMKGILAKTCAATAYKVLHPEESELEKQQDLLTEFINWLLECLGLDEYRLRELWDLKQTEYTYSIRTFSAKEKKLLAAGNLAELGISYDRLFADVMEKTLYSAPRQSSLIEPVVTLYDTLLSPSQGDKKKKKFIIILTDATEVLPRHVERFMQNVGRFYKDKDQYLRVFSILFPNVPRSVDSTQVYPYEEGKIVLLSKISEFIVYLNNRSQYTPERLRAANSDFFQRMQLFFQEEDDVRAAYRKKLDRFAELFARMPDGKLLSINEIATSNFLKNHVERTGSFAGRTEGRPAGQQDFFLYTFIDHNLFDVDNLDSSDWPASEDENERISGGDLDILRAKLFGQPPSDEAVQKTFEDIADTFVNQFIIIDKEPDKEALIFKISLWLSFVAIFFSVANAFIFYRYNFNLTVGARRVDRWARVVIPWGMIVMLIIVIVYLRFEDRWTLYGNTFWAFCVAVWFLFSFHFLPRMMPVLGQPFYAVYLWTVRRAWLVKWVVRLALALVAAVAIPVASVIFFLPHWVSRLTGKETMPAQPFSAQTYYFAEKKWLRRIDFALFRVLVPLLSMSLFLQILAPVYKARIKPSDNWFIRSLDVFFQNFLGLSHHHKVIEYFLGLLLFTTAAYFLRSWLYSRTIVDSN